MADSVIDDKIPTWNSEEDWEALSRRFQNKTTVDILEIVNGEKSTRRLSDTDLDMWLDMSPHWPRTQLRILFIDEDQNDRNKICASAATLKILFQRLNISLRFRELLYSRSNGSRVVRYDEDNQLSWHEFWYNTVFWSPPDPKTTHSGKKLLRWSFMNVWMGRHTDTGEIAMLFSGCPPDVKLAFLLMPNDYFKAHLRHPMLIHLHFLRRLAHNHWNTLRNRMRPLYEEEQKLREMSERSQSLLFICRQFSAFLHGSDLAQSLIERVIKENHWISQHLPSHATERERKIWHHDCESLAEGLHELLDGFKIRSRYAQMYEHRAKIGIDESFAMISRLDSTTNIEMAHRSESNGRSLWILQLLALFFLPLSLSMSIFGMGFFSTLVDSKGNAKLLVSHKWWYFLAVAMPSTALMYLSVLGQRLWEIRKDRMKTKGLSV